MSAEIKSKNDRLRMPWNKGCLVGQKRPLRPKEVWAIRVRLQMKQRKRDLALFNLAIDSKLRGCDLVSLRVDDIAAGGRVRDRATIIQHKTGRPVQFEIMEQTRVSLQEWLEQRFQVPSVGGKCDAEGVNMLRGSCKRGTMAENPETRLIGAGEERTPS